MDKKLKDAFNTIKEHKKLLDESYKVKEIEDFIKAGILRKELGRALNDTYDSRQIGDYAIGFMITKDEAESRLEKARNFVTEVEQHLKEVI